MEPRSPLQDLIALAHEPSSGRRRELLRRVTDLFFGAASSLSPTEAGAFDGVFCTLAQDMEMDIRAELAERFARRPPRARRPRGAAGAGLHRGGAAGPVQPPPAR